MRAYLIIIFQVRQQHMSEVPLSEHNNVVKAFPSDRTDQPFGTSILPRGAWRRWSVANAHRSKSSDEDIAIGPIAIADQIVGNLFPAESFRNLICNPFCGRMRCDAEPYDLSSAVPHDQQSIEQTKRDCRHDEQIHRGDAVGMIVEECLPSLGPRASSPGHILGHTRLPDFDPELEQLSMDPRRSPQRISNAHLADKLAYLRRYIWSATTTSRLPAPIRSETRAMPTDDCIRFNDRQRIANFREQPIETNEYHSVAGAKGEFLWSSSPQNVDLLPQRANLCLKHYPRPDQIDNHPTNEPAKIPHCARSSSDSRSTAKQNKVCDRDSHLITVSGFTIAKAPSTFEAKRYKPANIRWSSIPNVGPFGDFRCNTLS